jgi:hypothetical protein
VLATRSAGKVAQPARLIAASAVAASREVFMHFSPGQMGCRTREDAPRPDLETFETNARERAMIPFGKRYSANSR